MPCLSLSPRHCLAPPPARCFSHKTAFAWKRSQNVLPINFTQNQIKFVKRKTTWYVCLYPLPLSLPTPPLPSPSLSQHSRSLAGFAPFSCLVSGPDRVLNSAKSFNSYWLACVDKGQRRARDQEGRRNCACVRPITMKIDGPLIQRRGRMKGKAIEVPLAVEPGEQQVLNVYCFNLQ